ncbi:hypothetical protein L9F63_027995 [Diploptera punctata]|uniref:Uncharacterized protein n=1 Tax=Diploptera punctata TaxID=6984 RepID=A0AAD7ZYW7_DIPPU|nr:hypothetical protein L9F63_027995 [Diploptera punctata]
MAMHFLYILIVVLQASSLRMSETNNLLVESISKCIISIANKYFVSDEPVIVYRPATTSCRDNESYGHALEQMIFQNLHEVMNLQTISLGCFREHYSSNSQIKPSSCIIILPNVHWKLQGTFARVYLMIISAMFKNRNIKVMIIPGTVYKSNVITNLMIKSILQSVWYESRIDNVIILVPHAIYKDSTYIRVEFLDIYSWFPQNQKPCSRNVTEITLIDQWMVSSNLFNKNVDFFPSKPLKNLQGCPVTVGTSYLPPFIFVSGDNTFSGLLHNLLFVIGRKLNVTFSFELVERVGKFDIMTPVSFSSHNLPDDCVTSYPYFKYILSWYVHAAPIPKWKGIVMGFQQIMWFLVILAFIFGTVTFWLFSNIHLMKYITLIEAIMNSLRTYLGMSIKIELRGSLSAVFFTLWLCYCMLIYTAYQSYLIGFLTNPGEYSPINTEEELI